MERRCILIADDDADVLGLMAETLTSEGFQVLTAENGAIALRMARKHPGQIDLLITDVGMPKLDGFDLQERLRQERPEIRILVISGALEPNITGVDFRLLRKPFGPAELRKEVAAILMAAR